MPSGKGALPIMQLFARNKLVTVHQKDSDTLWVHAVMEDDIYGLTIDADVRLADLTFLDVVVAWNRHTTPECPRALDHVKEVEGLRIDADITHNLQKGVGRAGCRHFATLLIECSKSVQEAAALLAWQEMSQENPALTLSEVLDNLDRFVGASSAGKQPPSSKPQKQENPTRITVAKPGQRETSPVASKKDGGFFIDLHVHTFPASPCANESVDKMIQAARHIGLDGICLTDHNYPWPADDVRALRQKHGFLILRGNEITTDEGHMVVFGLDREMNAQGVVKLETLRRMVNEAEGVIIAAHPFRGFLTFGVGKLGLTVEKASDRPLFQLVDAVEVLNGMVTEEENSFAAKVCEHLGLPGTGGSDAHQPDRVGCYATRFEKPIASEVDLIEALKNGQCRAVCYHPATMAP
jgi:predicted metal-dependent phosphoesterase TrpH